jgi:hypothetical protein
LQFGGTKSDCPEQTGNLISLLEMCEPVHLQKFL